MDFAFPWVSSKINNEETVINFGYVKSEGISQYRMSKISIANKSFISIPPMSSPQIIIINLIQKVKLISSIRIDRNSIQEHWTLHQLKIWVWVLINYHYNIMNDLKISSMISIDLERTQSDWFEIHQTCHV